MKFWPKRGPSYPFLPIMKANSDLTEDQAGEISYGMVTTFGVVQFFGVLFAPLNGVVIDSVFARATNYTPDVRKYVSLAASVFLVTLLGSIFSLLAIIPSVKLQYVTFTLSVLHRAFVYGANATVIGMCFPMEYFGKLYGISQFCTVLSALAIGPIKKMANNVGFSKVNKFILFGEILTIWHFCIFLYYIKKKKSPEKNTANGAL
jgi:hypothetical protein